ncbi:ABC transporter ATP-binding protein [Kallotenue papyrolyticum]|uniref:ABC transporter ATP-binding protein n=1 Tax=Kallotenue papyrolyticum TaxID=1325125 RepID=UPI0004927B44|nr:ABC transporter ATP-binding protein [Kallotenue papyrolyticum]
MSNSEFTVADAHQYPTQSPVRWIVAHLLRYPWLLVGLLLAALAEAGLYALTPVLVGRAFTLLSAAAQPAQALSAGLATIALLIVGQRVLHSGAALAYAYAGEMLAKRFERDARDELVRSLLGKSQTFHNRQQVGDIMARATGDVRQLSSMVQPGLSLIFQAFLNLAAPLVAIAGLEARLLVAPLLFTLAFLWALRRYTRALNPVAAAARMRYGLMNARLAETISGIEVVKAYAQEDAAQASFLRDATAVRDLAVREGEIRARYLPLLLFGLMFGAAFAHALLLYRQGAIPIGTVVAYMGLLGVLRFPTFISIWAFALVQMGVAGARRILELITAETELDENAGGIVKPMEGAIRFEQVSFGYAPTGGEHTTAAGKPGVVAAGSGGRSGMLDPSLAILEDISFEARPGETIAIVGQTGSGKSTLTKLVNRIYDPTAGRVLIDGIDARDWNLQSLRSQISTIEQDVFLFSRSIADNIAFGAPPGTTRAQIEQAAREAQAHEFIMQLPEGYDTVIGERGVTLSGGQRQRLAIARAFLTDPRILILDDSTSAIDSATEDQIQRAMRRIMQGRTTLLITHRLSQIRWADRILVLRRGRLVAQGTHEELLRTSEAYRRIFARVADETAREERPA